MGYINENTETENELLNTIQTLKEKLNNTNSFEEINNNLSNIKNSMQTNPAQIQNAGIYNDMSETITFLNNKKAQFQNQVNDLKNKLDLEKQNIQQYYGLMNTQYFENQINSLKNQISSLENQINSLKNLTSDIKNLTNMLVTGFNIPYKNVIKSINSELLVTEINITNNEKKEMSNQLKLVEYQFIKTLNQNFELKRIIDLDTLKEK